MHTKILSACFSLGICCGSLTLALDEPGAVQAVNDAVDAASRRIAAEAAGTIAALGSRPSTNQIAAIVFKAVRSSPDSVLHIVDATVRLSPRAAIPDLVTAATTAVPNRWKQVTYRRLTALVAKRPAPDDSIGPKQSGLSIGLSAQGSSDPGANSADGVPMTLAEAIARTAFDAEPSLSFSAVQAAVNAALLADAATLLHNIENPRAASGNTDSGVSTYANEPLRTPKQPAVSR